MRKLLLAVPLLCACSLLQQVASSAFERPSLSFKEARLPSIDFNNWQQTAVLWCFNVAAIVAMFFSTQFADRHFAAERFLALSQLIGGIAMIALVTTKSFVPMHAGQHYFALTTHTHRFGVLSTLERATSENDPNATLLYTSDSWAEPPLTTYDPPLTFNGDGLRLTCNYRNTTTDPVSFGTSALDEMCFFWGYYY